jgi:hypothetical protein
MTNFVEEDSITILWLANCYFSSHRACNIVTSCSRVSAGLHWWSLILKAFAPDSIFGTDNVRQRYSWVLKARNYEGSVASGQNTSHNSNLF